ncbi:hypothetical protein [Desmospora profundinema]|uniref:Uncharacterized protein n=1 Tax=Desmospora profundinema TaxID=1571184 RepID=A0ABU1IUU0_9BACL|nr:hypothetical protein [Desmospora profundinema]MDR6227515.1 hypothetical protein [Desmospora profundinema]
MKRFWVVFLSFALLMVMISPGSTYADTQKELWTAEKYLQWLDEKAKDDPDAEDVAKEFTNLPKTDQAKILDQINNPDPEKYAAMFKEMEESIEMDEAELLKAKTCKKKRKPCRTSYTKKFKWMGVAGTMAQFQVWVKYNHDGKKVTRIHSKGAWEKIYNPAMSASHGAVTAWKEGKWVGAEVYWKLKIKLHWEGITVMNVEQRVEKRIGKSRWGYWIVR